MAGTLRIKSRVFVLNLHKLISGASEQGSISAMNFGSIAVLGVFLSPEDFSTYVILMSVLTAGLLLNSTLWGLPTLVLSQTVYAKKQNSYARTLLIISLISSFLVTLLILGLFAFLSGPILPLIWWLSVFACIPWSVYEVYRRICFSVGKTTILMWSSFAILAFYAVLIASAFTVNKLALESALAIWFFAFSIGCIAIVISIVSSRFYDSYNFSPSFYVILGSHWHYAKWQLLGSIAFWLSSSGFIFISSYYLDGLEVAALRLAQNLLGVSSILLLLFENMLTPRAASVYRKAGVDGLLEFVKSLYRTHIALYFIGLMCASAISVLIYNYFYAEKYNVGPHFLVFFVLFQMVMGLLFPLLTALRVMSKTKFFWYGHAAAAFFMMTAGLIMVEFFGVFGGGVSFLGSSLVFSLVIIISFWVSVVSLSGNNDPL